MRRTGSGKNEHDKLIREEFARQVDSMPMSPMFASSDILDRIKSAARLTGSSRVLDLGCGPGIVTEAFADDAGEVVAFDIAPEMIHHAFQRCKEAGQANVHFVVGHAERLPFQEASFDIIVTRLTFHHFPDPGTVISEMSRVIRSGGNIIIADIVSSAVLEESKLHNALEVLRDPSHVKMLSCTDLKHIVRSAGLVIEAEDGWIREREFGEWLQITNAPERSEPLYVIMQSLAKAGAKAGIDLRTNGTTVKFNHRWILLTAKKA
jgi:ubiquinone/menaquinone biosynthesis C-methylase UbiE